MQEVPILCLPHIDVSLPSSSLHLSFSLSPLPISLPLPPPSLPLCLKINGNNILGEDFLKIFLKSPALAGLAEDQPLDRRASGRGCVPRLQAWFLQVGGSQSCVSYLSLCLCPSLSGSLKINGESTLRWGLITRSLGMGMWFLSLGFCSGVSWIGLREEIFKKGRNSSEPLPVHPVYLLILEVKQIDDGNEHQKPRKCPC